MRVRLEQQPPAAAAESAGGVVSPRREAAQKDCRRRRSRRIHRLSLVRSLAASAAAGGGGGGGAAPTAVAVPAHIAVLAVVDRRRRGTARKRSDHAMVYQSRPCYGSSNHVILRFIKLGHAMVAYFAKDKSVFSALIIR